ncbi:alpha/beta hydrolase family protein [Sarocladium implicatum]|nr:alpha/beta hydrolase family protein [Sarocladium implicatum]
MRTDKPEVLIIAGGWHTPESYAKLTNAFKNEGYEVHCPRHQSVTSVRPPVAGLAEDSANLRAFVEELLQSGKRMVVIAHSYGGMVASNSLYGQSVDSRAARGLSGGIVRLIYMCAFALEEGKSMVDQVIEAGHGDLLPIGFKWADDMTVLCADPRLQLISEGPSDEEANEYLSTLDLWNGQCMHDKLQHAAWRELPVGYISGHIDACVPLSYQTSMIERLRGTGREVPVLDLEKAGHSPNLMHSEEIVHFVGRVST